MAFVRPVSNSYLRREGWSSHFASSAPKVELRLLFGEFQSEFEIKGDNTAMTGWDIHKQNFSFVYFDFRFTLSVFLTGSAGITRLLVAASPLTFQVTPTI